MTKLVSYFKAFVKPFEEANTNTNINTRFECFTPECRRIVMDSLDIEAGTVVDAESFFPGVSMNMGGCVSYTGNTRPDEEFAQIMRSCFSPIQVVDACDLH